MDCGDAGHILLSKRLADDLGQYGKWRAQLHALGPIEVKHGVRVEVVNLYTDAVGNRDVPSRFRQRSVGLRRRRLAMAAASAVLVGAIGLGGWYFYERIAQNIRGAARGNDTTIPIPAQSVAVLPFDNLSSDQENAFFADGIQDDLLTSLARIKDLKVISRSSVLFYRDGATRKLPKIRRELGVAAILEGSVRRVADRVLVNVQLIDTATESHIWAQRYDRTLADSISLQGEPAGEIATALAAKMTPDEKSRVENKPTESSDAYVMYLKGREIQLRPEVSPANYRAAANFYQQAITVDPKFVLARAQLAQMQTALYDFEPTPALLAEARSNADEAVRLDPNAGEAHLALAWCMVTADLDPVGIKRALAAALRLLPNDGYAALSAAILQKFKGWTAESRASFERAILLNPREGRFFYNYATLLRESFGEAERARWALDRPLELAPDSVFFRLYRAHAELQWSGDTSRIKAVVAALPAGKDPDGRVTALRCDVALLERDFPAALATLAACPLSQIPLLEFGFGSMVRKELVEGLVRFYAGDRQGAYEVLDAARWKLETDAEDHVGEAYHIDLATAYAATGWNDAARGRICTLQR